MTIKELELIETMLNVIDELSETIKQIDQRQYSCYVGSQNLNKAHNILEELKLDKGEQTPDTEEEKEKQQDLYYSNHLYCPQCGGENYMYTMVGYVFEKLETYKDKNRVTCPCGWKGIVHDLTRTKITDYNISGSHDYNIECKHCGKNVLTDNKFNIDSVNHDINCPIR